MLHPARVFASIALVAVFAHHGHASAAFQGNQTAVPGASRFALLLVNDARGKAIVDVGIDDVVVQEDGANRDVLDVRVADYPIVIVVDNAASAEVLDAVKTAIGRFLERLGPRPVALIASAPPRIISTFEDERENAVEQLGQLERADEVKSEPLRAASLGAQAIHQTGALFSTIVMAVASPVEAQADATAELSAPIIDSRAALHVIADDTIAAATAGPLRRLAQQTRGAYTPIFAAASYLPALERLAVRLTTELLVEYIVPTGSRAIDPKIGVRIPGARVQGLGVAPR